MMRIALILFCLISQFSWSQADTSNTELDSIVLEPDFVPLKLNGKWVWYDILNEKASESVYITDFAIQESGFYSSYIVKDSSHWGVLDLFGDTICAFAYDSIIYTDNQLLTQFNDEWSYHLNSDLGGDSLIPVSFDSLYFNGTDTYLFNQGKTGMILRNRTIIQAKYDGIHHFRNTSGNGYDRYFMSLNGKEYNLLNEQGEELLPKGVWDLRCTEDGVFEFRTGNNPSYFIPYSGEIVQPNGRDIIFYSGAYKLYNEENTKSELHFSDGNVLKDQYDDYFLLSGDFIAVRKDGKVGLTKNGVQVLGEIKYDQINPFIFPNWDVTDFHDYFKFYVGDSCGLMDEFGNELFDARYANILITWDDNRFIVLDRNKSGIVDRTGKTIIPLIYDAVELEKGANLIVVEQGDRVGLFDYDGKQRTPIEYEGYSNLQTFRVGEYMDALLALEKQGKFYFVNRSGFIDKNGFDHFNFSQDVLKTYDAKAISVFLFDQKGRIEDRSNYPVFRNAIVRKNYRKNLGTLPSWDVSEIEENQQEGYFGLRWYKKRGFGVEPVYRTIRDIGLGDYLGFVPVEKNRYELTINSSAEIVGAAHHLKLGSGSTDGKPYFNSEIPLIQNGSGDRFINRSVDGEQHRAYDYNPVQGSIGLADKVHFSDHIGGDYMYRIYFKGGEVEVCPIESSDVSFYAYFQYLNCTDGLRVSAEDMKTILNPKKGVRFKNAECEIINSSAYDLFEAYGNYKTVQSFEDYYFLNQSVFYEKPLEAELGTLRLKRLPKKGKEEITVENVIEASCPEALFTNDGGFNIVAKIKKNQMAKIHIDYPNYFFHQDSIDLSYEASRITRRVDSNSVRLITPNGNIIADSCLMIRYLNEECFALLRKNGWQLIDKNGNQLTDALYAAVAEFKGDRVEFKLKDGTAVLLNSNGEELMPLPEPRIFLDDDHYYFASNPQQLTERFSNLTDEAREKEKYLSKGFFVSKKEGKTIIRRFGTSNQIKLKSTPTLKRFGSCLYYKNGKHIYSIDSNLVVNKFKKMDKFRTVTPEIGWLEGKQDHLIDADWNYICKMTKNQRFELRDGDLVLLEGDSVYKNFGSLKPIDENLELSKKTPEVKVISENGKYGVRRDQDTILPINYLWLSKINDQEFMTKTDSENQLYGLNLKRIGNRPFDRFIETYKGNFVFFYNDQVYVLSDDRKTLKFIH